MKVLTKKYPNTPVALSEIEDFEKSIGVCLPTTYKNFILEYAGCPTLECQSSEGFIDFFFMFSFPTTQKSSVVKEYFRIREDLDSMLTDNEDWFEESWLQKWLPFGMDAFGNLFCIQLTGSGTGGVFFYNHETADDDPFLFMNSSFEEFIDSLTTPLHTNEIEST